MSQELGFWWFRGWFEGIAAWASFENLAHTRKACACLEDIWCLRCTRSRCRSGTLVADMGRELVCWLQGVVFGPGSAKKKKWLTDSYSFQRISISSYFKAPTLEVKSWRWSVFQEALREVSGSQHLRRKTEMSAMSASTSLGDMIMEGKLIRPQTIGWIMFECFLVLWGTLFSHSFSLFLYFFVFCGFMEVCCLQSCYVMHGLCRWICCWNCFGRCHQRVRSLQQVGWLAKGVRSVPQTTSIFRQSQWRWNKLTISLTIPYWYEQEFTNYDYRKLWVVSDIQALDSHADLPDLVWHFLDGRGGGLSLLNAMKIAQGEAQPSRNGLGAEM